MPIRRAVIPVIGLICILTAACSAKTHPIAMPDPNAHDPAGWYELAPGHRVLVTWAPQQGELRLLDFDSVRFNALRAAPEGGYLWNPRDTLPQRRVVFRREVTGAVSGFRWSDERGAMGDATRAREAPFDQQQVRFVGKDSVVLAGLLMVPRVKKLVGPMGGRLREVPVMLPGAVIIHGSGDSDRDNVWAFHIAQHLARSGVVVLFPDKRGSGASGGDWRTADFGDLAADALAGVELLRTHAMVDAERVGLVGLSQGGWIAPLAARDDEDVAFVINVSGSAVTPAEQVQHEVAQDLRKAGLADEDMADVLDLVGLADAYSRALSGPAWAAYTARRDSLLQTSVAEVVEPLPSTREHWRWQWWHDVLDLDPVPLWRSLERPALIVYGGEDEHDNVPVEASVSALRAALQPEQHPERVIRVFPESGHALGNASGWIDPAFLELLSSWVEEHVGAESDRESDG